MKREGTRSALAGLPVVTAALWAALTAIPVVAGLFDDEVARKEIVEQQKRLDGLKQQSDALAERLAKVEDALKNQPVFGLASQIETLREELRTLRGQLEVIANNLDMAAKRQRDMYVDIDTRLRRLEQPGTAAAPAPAAPAAPAPGATAPPAGSAGATTIAAGGTAPGQVASPGALSAPAADESRAYETAQNQRRIGNYQGAIIAFQGFVAQYPKSTLAPRAQYWIGDSHYNLRDFKNAIANQQKLISTYPDSSSVPDALLNIASSQIELGDTAAARKTMDGLVARYPTSEAAEKAKRRLATLK